MQVLVKTSEGVGNVTIDERQKPEIKNDEVLVKVKAAGVTSTANTLNCPAEREYVTPERDRVPVYEIPLTPFMLRISTS